MPLYLNDFIDLLAEICKERGLKCTTSNATGRLITCVTATVGAFLFGPIGLAIGGAVGGALATTTAPEDMTASDVLNNLSRDEKQILSDKVMHVFRDFGYEDFTAVAAAMLSQPSMKDVAIKEVNNFITKEMGLKVCAYDMVYDKDLSNIPINSMLSNNGLVAVWCTSAPSHINSVLTELFPAWGVQYVTQWFWLKVTKFGKLICALSESSKKQPFERIIFGVKKNSVRSQPNPGSNKVIMSVPSAIHSHKPPLCELLKPYLPEAPRCLELFARYLLPGWTSYGNEVLKLQHMSLYNEENIKETS